MVRPPEVKEAREVASLAPPEPVSEEPVSGAPASVGPPETAASVEDLCVEVSLLFLRVVRSLRRLSDPLPAPLREQVRQLVSPALGSRLAGARGREPSGRHLGVLLTLALAGPMSVGHLAERTDSSLATTSAVVGELADLGLVVRAEDPADRRRTLVSIPDAHREVVERVLAARLRPLARALGQLDPDDAAGLTSGLRHLAAALEAAGSVASSDHLAETDAGSTDREGRPAGREQDRERRTAVGGAGLGGSAATRETEERDE